MSVRIPRWFGVPPEFFESGHCAAIRDGAVRLYVLLCWMSDRKSSRMFELKDSHIVEMTGLSKRSLSAARKQLSERGLAICNRDPGGHYTYTLCDLKTGQPFPGDPKAEVRYQKKSAGRVASIPAPKPPAPKSPVTVPVIPGRIVRAEQTDMSDTSFNFGHNAKNSEPSINPSEGRWFAPDHFESTF